MPLNKVSLLWYSESLCFCQSESLGDEWVMSGAGTQSRLSSQLFLWSECMHGLNFIIVSSAVRIAPDGKRMTHFLFFFTGCPQTRYLSPTRFYWVSLFDLLFPWTRRCWRSSLPPRCKQTCLSVPTRWKHACWNMHVETCMWKLRSPDAWCSYELEKETLWICVLESREHRLAELCPRTVAPLSHLHWISSKIPWGKIMEKAKLHSFEKNKTNYIPSCAQFLRKSSTLTNYVFMLLSKIRDK